MASTLTPGKFHVKSKGERESGGGYCMLHILFVRGRCEITAG